MANYAKRRPALGWGGIKRTVIDTGFADEVSPGWLARGWRYYGGNGGGPYLPFFGAPQVRLDSTYGPVTVVPPDEIGVFAADGPQTDWAVLGGWVDSVGIYTALVSSSAGKTFSGLTPGTTVGYTFTFAYTLDTGGGSVYASIAGGATGSLFVAGDAGLTFWTPDGRPRVASGYLTAVVPVTGDVDVRFGWRDMGPTGANGQGGFGGFELVEISDAGTRPNLLVWGTPPFRVTTYPVPLGGTGWSKRFPSGRRSVWKDADAVLDRLEMVVPYIPQVDRLRVGGPNGLDASGADGALGWRAALEYGRTGGVFTYYPDQDDLSIDPVDCVLVAPLRDPYDRGDASLLRGLTMRLETLNPGDTFPEY